MSFYETEESDTRGCGSQVIDLAEIWVALTLLAPGEGPRVLEIDLAPRVEKSCKLIQQQGAQGLELEWGDTTGSVQLASLPSSTDGKQFYIAWLKDRYAYNIARLNTAYGLEATSFTDLTESDFSKVDRKRPAVAEDDRLFLAELAAIIQQKVDVLLQSCAAGRKTAWKRSRT
jgi:hypothetical protein